MITFPIQVSDESPFPLENIPFGIFSYGNSTRRACTAIGDVVVDLSVLEQEELLDFKLPDAPVFAQPSLNSFAASPKLTRIDIRRKIIDILSDGNSVVFTDTTLNKAVFYAMKDVDLHLPMDVPEFSDFSCYEEHVGNATKMSKMPFPENFYHSPIAYNSRSASIVPSGTEVPRPLGVYKDSTGKPAFQPSRKLDYELELGILVSKPVPFGTRVSPDEAYEEHVFGYVLVNDWSSRDIQPYESYPAGPFNSKSFATSMSSWVVVPEALEEAKATPINQTMDCVPQHIRHAQTLENTIYDINVQAYIKRNGNDSRTKISRTNVKHSYFSIGQMLSHRASSCGGMRTGDLVATGTISSPESLRPDPHLAHNASLWELSWNGTREVPFVGGTFMEDGDEVTFDGWARGKNGKIIGFGELVNRVVAPIPL